MGRMHHLCSTSMLNKKQSKLFWQKSIHHMLCIMTTTTMCSHNIKEGCWWRLMKNLRLSVEFRPWEMTHARHQLTEVASSSRSLTTLVPQFWSVSSVTTFPQLFIPSLLTKGVASILIVKPVHTLTALPSQKIMIYSSCLILEQTLSIGMTLLLRKLYGWRKNHWKF